MPELHPLGRLMQDVMDREGWTSVKELKRHTDAVSYQTLYAWVSGRVERNRRRPPAAPVLEQLADDLRLSRAAVFAAAGRTYGDSPTPQELEFASVMRAVPEDERDGVLIFTSLAGRLSPADRQTVLRLMRDMSSREA